MVDRRSRAASRSAGLALVAGALLSLAACGSGATRAPSARPGDLVNTALGPDYAGWLVGPVARIATPAEIEAYSHLTDDFAAGDFIETFWSRRDPDPAEPGNPVRLELERRAADADRLYGEGGVLGRRTARGTIYVLYGEPAKVSYEVAPRDGSAVEVWTYAEDAPAGLDGRRPEHFYWFHEQGGVTTFYQPGARRAVPPPR